MRLFVALALPEELRQQLADLQRGLREARWVAPENIHLTLQFLGEIDGGLAGDIDTALTQLRQEAFAIRLEGLGTFGEGRHLRVLWAGVAPSQALLRLQSKVVRASETAGFQPEGRRFKPHVTLARFKRASGAGLSDYLGSHGAFKSAPFPVREVLLYSSHLTRAGAIYRPEARYPLEALADAAFHEK